MVAVAIPEGYSEIPLTDVVTHAQHLFEFTGKQPPSDKPTILGAVTALIGNLVDNGTRYIGIGSHQIPGGQPLHSCLTVSVVDAPGGPRSPRLALAAVVRSRSNDGTTGHSALIESERHPILFTEKVGEVPTQLAGTDRAHSVYQLEAVVSSEDGTALAAIQLASPDTERGALCRKMVADMASSVVFGAPATVTLDMS
ncbi:hypothetical protein ACIA5E_21470 [Nocardia asteroides]|uniref:hypothetical protein n=1 Tax=Nocardia asteroides TaxID=1824 RepID=UPI0037B15A53